MGNYLRLEFGGEEFLDELERAAPSDIPEKEKISDTQITAEPSEESEIDTSK